MTVSDIFNLVNTYIGDTSTDRLSQADRYQAVTEGTAWLLEELGNEHMVDRTDFQYLPTVKWYKMDGITPYLLTAGQLRLKEDNTDRIDFTLTEARDLASMPANRHAYAIERYNDQSYLGVIVPTTTSGNYKDLVDLSLSDSLTYTGVNADNIVKYKEYVSFDTEASGQASTGINTTSEAQNLTDYEKEGVFVFEIEIPDVTDINSISLKFGEDLTTDYWIGTTTTDVNNNPLVTGLNVIKIKWSDLSVTGTPDITNVTKWEWRINHETTQTPVTDYRLSDLRVVKPVDMTFKYIFYRVGKDAAGAELTEFSATTDVPFFSERYPQYKFAVAHKAAGVLFRSLQLIQNARSEDAEANRTLERYRKNFSGERDSSDSSFKVAGVNFRSRRVIRRR